MKEQICIKRNNSIKRLCSDHYNDLKVVCTIRKALRYDVPYTSIINYIRSEFSAHLERHFVEEETWLFEKVARDDSKRKLAESQHKQMRTLLTECNSLVGELSTLPQRFADLLEEHIRFEERVFFPYLLTTVEDGK